MSFAYHTTVDRPDFGRSHVERSISAPIQVGLLLAVGLLGILASYFAGIDPTTLAP